MLPALFMTNSGRRLDSGTGKALLGEEERSKVFLFTLSDWKPQVFAREADSLVSGKSSRGPLWFSYCHLDKSAVFELLSHLTT